MKIQFAGSVHGYTSDDEEEIICVSPSSDGSVGFLVVRQGDVIEEWTLTFDPKRRAWLHTVRRLDNLKAA